MQAMHSVTHGRDGYEQWCHDVRAICGRFESRAPRHLDDFAGHIALHRRPGLEFAQVATNAHSLAKSGHDTRAEDGLYYFLIYQRQGHSVLSQQGRQAVLDTGDLALIDSRLPSEFVYVADTQHVSVHLPCEALERRLRSPRPQLARTLAAASPMGTVLGGFVEQIAARHELFGEREGAALTDALLALLAPLADDSEHAGGRARDWARVAAYIDERLHEDLDPQDIARSCAVSVRSLYRLFEARDTTLGTYLRERRLACCAEALSTPAWQHESVTQIALRWGFKDSAHFSRSFKARYGMAPREWRHRPR